jgi:hypothetical protein
MRFGNQGLGPSNPCPGYLDTNCVALGSLALYPARLAPGRAHVASFPARQGTGDMFKTAIVNSVPAFPHAVPDFVIAVFAAVIASPSVSVV